MTVSVGGVEFDHVRYDAPRDVLYLSAGEPREAAESHASPEGHEIRYDDAGKIIGYTIINARWFMERDGTISISEPPARVDADDLDRVLAV